VACGFVIIVTVPTDIHNKKSFY